MERLVQMVRRGDTSADFGSGLGLRVARLTAVLGFMTVFGACGDPATKNGSGGDGGAAIDAAASKQDIAGIDAPASPDSSLDTVTPPNDVVGDIADVVGPKAPFGEPCTTDDACADGHCTDGPSGRLCTRECGDGCPEGWACEPLEGSPEAPAVCVSLYGALCNPCRENAECSFGGDDARCVRAGDEGSFCAAPCGEGCPFGFECKSATDVTGATVDQCLPKNGEPCTCRDSAIEAELDTDCGLTNEHGTCEGTRGCTEAGLSACSAAEPAEEACGGGDEDCDGETDEEGAEGCTTYYMDQDSDGFGLLSDKGCFCAQTGDYKATKAGDCDDANPGVFPGEPCGKAACADAMLTPASTCEASGECTTEEAAECPDGFGCANATSCRASCKTFADCAAGFYCEATACVPTNTDGTPCASGEQCASGYCGNGFCCTGGDCCKTAGDCDDGNTCTTEACEGSQCAHAANTATCSVATCSGTALLGAAVCQDGTCGAPPVTDCTGDDPCKVYGCDAVLGCTETSATVGTLCGAPSCEGYELSSTQSCDGLGGCNLGGGTEPCPGGYTCLTASSCRSQCTTSEHCAPGSYCEASVCKVERDDGEACTKDAQCGSGHCNNGFCCEAGLCCSSGDDCQDGNVCTTDTCEEFQCKSVDFGGECAASKCVGLTHVAAAMCGAGACGEPLTEDCAGNDPCKSYSCSAELGCTTANAEAGTPCGPPACEGFVLTAESTCGAGGTCADSTTSAPCAGGFTCKDESSCRVACFEDTHCQPGQHCEGSVCKANKANGQACSASSECASAHCEGGFCCASGLCCGGNDAQCDDGNECTDDACSATFQCITTNNAAECMAPTCGTGSLYTAPMMCVGGACSAGGESTSCKSDDPCTTSSCTLDGCAFGNALPGVTCAVPTCAGYELTSPLTCDGLGGCTIGGGTEPCPNGYGCLTATTCRSQCQSDEQCGPDYYCKASKCTAKHDNGQKCGGASQCLSGHCDNGFCCDEGLCCSQASDCDDENGCTTETCADSQCASAANTSACAPATCNGLSFVGQSTCSGGDCQSAEPTDCGGDNVCAIYGCDPLTGCTEKLSTQGTPCGSGSCSGFTLTSASVCDGNGTCAEGAGQGPCPGGFLCANATSCKSACAADGDCRDGFFCQATVCLPKRTNGETCTQAKQCESAHCQGGFCCADGKCCGGNDAHCNDGNTCTDDSCSPDYQCVTATNTAQCAPPGCQGTEYTAAMTCDGGVCGGGGEVTDCKGDNPCKVYGCGSGGCTETDAVPGKLCKLASCSGNMLTSSTSCNETGSCEVGGGAEPCPNGYGCLNTSSCRTQCSFDAHCAPTHHCSASQCVPRVNDGESCLSDSQCVSNHCGGGVCCSGGDCCVQDATCDDSDPCTDDICAGFSCGHAYNTAPCTEPICADSTWTSAGTCNAGECDPPATTTPCGGSNACIIYGCDPVTGCTTDAAPQTTPCGVPACSGFTLTPAAMCDGTGGCAPPADAAPCPGGTVCKGATACLATCAVDEDCQEGFICLDGACTEKKPDGELCGTPNECLSDYCESGLCCASGSCCTEDAGCDDGNVCTTDTCVDSMCAFDFNTAPCGEPECQGLLHIGDRFCQDGACALAETTDFCGGSDPCLTYGCDDATGCTTELAESGTPCGDGSCVGSTLTSALVCDAGGACVPGAGSGPCPGGLLCASDSACKSSCAADSDCRSDFYCSASLCLPKKENGGACAADKECESAHCENGFCCDTGKCCGGNNSQCAMAGCTGDLFLAAESCGADFQCSVVTPEDCSGDDPCNTFECSAQAGCQVIPVGAGALCGVPVCTGNLLTEAATCSGTGACDSPPAPAACPGNLGCADSESCLSACAVDADCVNGFYCAAGECIAKHGDGSPCAQGNECDSSYCANGACCEDDGTAPACCGPTAPCAPGVCAGESYTQPATCSAASRCEAGSVVDCGGVNVCEEYSCDASQGGCVVGPAVDTKACGAAICSGYLITPTPLCDGLGECGELPAAVPCPGGLTCASTSSCRETCTTDTQCQAGHFCNDGACEAKKPNGSTCGGSQQCSSGHCDSGLCCNSGTCCSTADTCNDGNSCTANACIGNACVTSNLDGQVCEAPACAGTSHIAAKTCASGACSAGGATTSCGDADACTTDLCVPTSGCTHTPVAGCCNVAADCDDALVCTADLCQANVCTYEPVAGCCSSDADCATGVQCVSDTCDLGTGNCVATPLTGVACDDGNPCTGNDLCTAGSCAGITLANGSPCDDGNAGTTNDGCVDGSCSCIADCAGKVCGDDGCGGSCGTCGNPTDACSPAGACIKIGDDCSNPFVVSSVPFNTNGSTVGAKNDYWYEAGWCPGENAWGKASSDKVYKFEVPASGPYNIDLKPYFDSNLYVITDCDSVETSCLGANEEIGSGVPEHLTLDLVSGETIYVVVDGYGNSTNDAGNYSLSITQCVPACAGKQCGDDGCGGTCGTCAGANDLCSSSGQCLMHGDACANPFVVGTLPFAATGNTTSANNDFSFSWGQCSGHPFESYGGSAKDHVYQFSVPVAGYYQIDLAPSFDSVLYVFSNCSNPGGTCLQADQEFGSGAAESIVRYFSAGTVFVAVDGRAAPSDAGDYTLTVKKGCDSNADCTQSEYCSSGKCYAKKTNGGTCSSASQCSSAYCNNGYCCGGGVCCGSSANCDDGNLCTSDSCGANSQCAQSNVANGTECKAEVCQSGIFYRTDTCQNGLCIDKGTEAYSCGDGACHATCETQSGCSADCLLTPAHTLVSGEHDYWSNSYGVTSVNTYSCSSLSYPGREYVYSFTPPLAGTLTIDRTGTGTLDTMLIEASGGTCNPNDCIGYEPGGGTKSFPVVSGKSYCIVVDHLYATGTSSFQIVPTFVSASGTCSNYFDEDWERTNWPRTWTASSDWNKSTHPSQGAYSKYAIPMFASDPVPTAPTLKTVAFDTTGCGTPRLTFKWWTTESTGSKSSMYLFYSADGGTTWTQQWYTTGSSSPGAIHTQTIYLAALANNPNARIGFATRSSNCSLFSPCAGEYGIGDVTVGK